MTSLQTGGAARALLGLCCLLLALGGGRAMASEADPTTTYPIASWAALLLDRDDALQPPQALEALEAGRFRKLAAHETRFGYTDATAWLALEVPPPLADTGDFVVALNATLLDSVRLHHVRGDGIVTQSFTNAAALVERSLPMQGVVLPVSDFDGGTDRLLLEARTRGSLTLGGALGTHEAIRARSVTMRQTASAFYGVMGALLVLNILLFALTSVRSLLYAALFVAATAGHHAASHDILALFMPAAHWPHLHEIYILCVFLSGIAAILFTRHALILRHATPRIDRSVQVLALVSAVSAMATPLIGVSYAYRIAAFLALTVNPLLLAAAVIRWRQGDRSARAIVLAWALLLLGIMLMMAYRLGWLPRPILTEDATYLLSALCALLLTFALVQRLLLLEEHGRLPLATDPTELGRATADGDRMVEELERSVHETNQALRTSNRQLEAMQLETAHHAEILRTLFSSSVAIHRIDQTDELLQTSLEQLAGLFPEHGFALVIHGERLGDVRHRAFLRIDAGLQDLIIANTQLLGDRVRSALRDLLVEHADTEAQQDMTHETHHGWQFLELPDRHRDTQGHLVIHGSDLPQRSMEVLGVFCSQIATAIENRRLSRELEQLANTDALTGIGNRKVFDDALRDAIEQASSNPRIDFCVLVIDLNGLKRINDSCGHEAGDEMIRAVADVMRACVRREDTIARLGGDEFVVLCPNARMPAAQELADRIARELALRSLQLIDTDGVTVEAAPSAAIGTASSHEVPPSAVFSTADARMYDAKERYYDQVRAN